MVTQTLSYRFTLMDHQGRPLVRYPWMPGHSFVKAYMKGLHCLWRLLNESSVEDTDNVARVLRNPVSAASRVMEVVSTAGEIRMGIVVGTGLTAVTMDDHALETQIINGTGAGQLLYQPTVVNAVIEAGANSSTLITRGFTNNSGATVTIFEAGIYFRWTDDGGTLRYFCMVRDKLGGGQDVPVLDGTTVNVDYLITISA